MGKQPPGAGGGAAMSGPEPHSRPGHHLSRLASNSPRLPKPSAGTTSGEDLMGPWITEQGLSPDRAPTSPPSPPCTPGEDTSTKRVSPAASHAIRAQGITTFVLEAMDSPWLPDSPGEISHHSLVLPCWVPKALCLKIQQIL